MGLGTQENGKYISIVGGRFCIRVPEGSEGAVSRVNKLGKNVTEKYYDNFTGKLLGIKVTDGNYGKQWEFAFGDDKEIYRLQLGYSNGFAKNIIKILPNVDLSKDMKITPQTKVEADGTKKSSLFINQDGVALKHAYTKDNPKGLPQMVQVTVKGELVWDDTDQMIFLEAMVMKDIVPKLAGVPQSVVPPSKTDVDFDNFGKPEAPVAPPTATSVEAPVKNTVNPDEVAF